MAPVTLFISFLLTYLVVLHSAAEETVSKLCAPTFCKDVSISFPFRYKEHSPECGLFPLNCSEGLPPRIQLKEGEDWHEFTKISKSEDTGIYDISIIVSKDLQQLLESRPCSDDNFEKLSLPSPTPRFSVSSTSTMTLLKCSNILDRYKLDHNRLRFGCISASHTYYYFAPNNIPWPPLPQCSVVQLPLIAGWNISNQHNTILTTNFILQVTVSEEMEECFECYSRGGICLLPHVGQPNYCSVAPKGKSYLNLKLGLGIGLGVPALLAACFFILWCYRQKCGSSNLLLSTNTPNSDLEGRSVYLGVPVFTYKELEEATNHFDCEKEIGDGGFGIVYHGKLKDGREVAVKRLYEHNSRRVEQFMNEIEILTHLRHKHLVTLYGCTSGRSRDLLLVYEYISNGTVADHLHGDRAATGSLTWPIRLKIAKETASALFYLYASDIVHRDVKTTNILIDSNFTVKVADFGISRFFPLDATHVSTAPQGTPGYVDPEYHECFQLTPKSDVYSFGVVLIELISSLPAVDIMRHREEINLSNIAINRIQNGLYSELVDSCLGFESDHEVRRTTIAVADLAFQCLQQDRDARPNMYEVLEALKNLNTTGCDARMEDSIQPSPSPHCDRIGLLKNTKAGSSPTSVIGTWTSSSLTVHARSPAPPLPQAPSAPLHRRGPPPGFGNQPRPPCSYCHDTNHARATCWKLYPHLRPKRPNYPRAKAALELVPEPDIYGVVGHDHHTAGGAPTTSVVGRGQIGSSHRTGNWSGVSKGPVVSSGSDIRRGQTRGTVSDRFTLHF
ncbi:LEAF RUST 10 DISEASE-RESISTANCE LOCUS RECEPTOR-LIKE PROTEIN KINASE-like 1.1 isoform X2 [Argentina anserina]|uniref:LEAF RUST 10 DISEASE-RESISTANCE LOCUS RECEPTOR-LIKE PROTEIN KINASE-like 1.1 isoform X2 n=1 Tax=Argentina anserina TaxID=57926 RepID=UPI0021765CEB|nr:LEAF RUST 10 DISEASE-RESISTANCE LOCUS RECEPTOR-LIKE PROTEIN KINASE-like 1.1 isoform X2 [Potentilla anserina]